jgi:hypothetical protein
MTVEPVAGDAAVYALIDRLKAADGDDVARIAGLLRAEPAQSREAEVEKMKALARVTTAKAI